MLLGLPGARSGAGQGIAAEMLCLHMAHRLTNHLHARVNLELLLDVVAVHRNRLRAEIELRGDFFGRLALAEKTKTSNSRSVSFSRSGRLAAGVAHEVRIRS